VKRQKDLFLMVEKLGKDRRSLFLVGGLRGKGAIKLIKKISLLLKLKRGVISILNTQKSTFYNYFNISFNSSMLISNKLSPM